MFDLLQRTIKELFDMSTTGNMGNATELVVEDLKAMASTPTATPPQVESTTAPAAKDNLTKEQLEQVRLICRVKIFLISMSPYKS